MKTKIKALLMASALCGGVLFGQSAIAADMTQAYVSAFQQTARNPALTQMAMLHARSPKAYEVIQNAVLTKAVMENNALLKQLIAKETHHG